MRKLFTIVFLFAILGGFAYSQQDGNNMLFGVPKVSKAASSIDSTLDAGRSIEFIPGPNSLDGDNLADILVVDYMDGGKVFVFEQVNPTSLEFKLVWGSKPLKKNYQGNRIRKTTTNITPRMVTYGDFDNNGKKEIIFPQGRTPADTILSDTTWPRGIYFYEWTGKDNDYGTEPYIIRPEKIDSFTKYHNWGRMERGGLVAADVDGDGKQELLVGGFDFAFNEDIRKNSSKVYVLSAKSGSIAQKNLIVDTEYVYRGMAKAINDVDGYVCSGIKVADIDGDGRNEVVVVGQTINGSGGGIGFFKSTATNTYKDGNVLDLTNSFGDNLFNVTSEMGVLKYQGKDIIFINTDEAAMGNVGNGRLLMLSDVIDIDLIGANNFTTLRMGNFGFCGTVVGDQDHGSGTDGFDIYIPTSSVTSILDLEYKGTGNIADSNNYNMYQIFNSKKVYKLGNGGIYQIIVPPSDINNNGRKEIIANFQQYGKDTVVNGNVPVYLTAPFLVIEWGDTLMGTVNVHPLVFITDEDYKLEQNYPNPFNPTTSIKFLLPTAENISLIVYDINGREVKKLIDGKNYEKGSYEATWDGKNEYGKTVASGNYFYKLKWGNFEKSMKMTYLK